MAHKLGWMIAIVLFTACGGDDAAPKGTYAEECMAKEDCGEGLDCLNRLCTAFCPGGDKDCSAFSSTSGCVGGSCYDICTDTSECPGDLQCVIAGDRGTCRPR